MATIPAGVQRVAAAQPEYEHYRGVPGHEVKFKLCGVEPPSALYVTMDDQLQVTLAGLTSAAVQLEVRILRADGTITVQEENLTGPNSRTPASRAYRLPEGYILSASLATPAPGVSRGQLYGMISMVRSQGPAPTYVYTLTTGYLGTLSPIWYPGIRGEQPGSAGGNLNTVTLANPAAGADWSYTPPAGVRQRVQSISATLTTSAAVANRTVTVRITQAGNLIYSSAAPAPQTASSTLTYNFVPGIPAQSAAGGTLVIPLPANLVINSTYTISVVTTGIQAGDQWSAINISTEDWFDV